MSSIDKLFANSLKNDITSSFVESIKAIMFLEQVTSEDFLKINTVKVYTPEIKENFGFYSQKKLAFNHSYSHETTQYDILGVWLYKLSENLRRIYSAKKKSNDYSSLIEQQNNLYIVSNELLPYWNTLNEETFFPRAIFGRHAYNLKPLDYLLYLGFHDSLTSDNFQHHLKLIETLMDKLDFSNLPDFIPKLALSSKNSKLFKTLLPFIPTSTLINALQYNKSSDGFKILSFEYFLEHSEKLQLSTNKKIDLIKTLLREDVLLSKHFDDFILDKAVFLDNLSSFITSEVSKEIEVQFIHKSSKFVEYKNLAKIFLNQQKKSNPYSLMSEIKNLTFEEIQDSYDLSPTLISETIQKIIENASLKENKNKDYYYYSFKNFVEKLHPVLEKKHLAEIISLNSEFISFCKPVYLHIRINEKLSEQPKIATDSVKKHKI